VARSALRAAEEELELHRERGHRLRALFARRRVERLHGQVVEEDALQMREKIAAYGVGTGQDPTFDERPPGYDRRSGQDRRRRSEGRFPDRRSGIDRRASTAH
jgi:hypothetical protein